MAGVSTGAAIALLYAPDTGQNTRDRLSFQLNKYLDKLKELLNRANEARDPNAAMHTDLNAEDSQRARELLREVESLLEDVKHKSA